MRAAVWQGGLDEAWLDAAPVALLVLDGDGACLRANREAIALFGPRSPVGLGLSAIFAEWKSRPALQSRRDEASLHYAPDGRAFSARSRRSAGGDWLLALNDVSIHLGEFERTARDPLTGLMLRSALAHRLAEALGLAARAGARLAVHYLDLDRFKDVNDSLGHPVGDALLARVAERLRAATGEDDFIARLGGDEFVVVQTRDATPQAAETLAVRFTDLVSRTYAIEGHTVNVGVSVGVALFPDHGADADTLLRHADLALYRAKSDGRGVARFFEAAMNARMQARRALEADLKRALALRQFRLQYQPIVNLASNRLVGFEALLRWTHPQRGAVSPADFIPLAEETGLITGIGEWVLRTACRRAASWRSNATVAVNISPEQIKGGRFPHIVAAALAESGLAAERLELEITEGTLLEETEVVLGALNAVKALGVKVSMDDFGTGYSSLSYLRKFPFDKIKIDQSFVRGLGANSDCDAIVRAVTGLGSSLGMRITAEGVETSDQLQRIRGEGCTEVQGYFTGRPMEAEAVDALIAEHEDKQS